MEEAKQGMNTTGQDATRFSTWVAAAIGTGVSILAAVGLSGNALARAVRVYPELTTMAGGLLLAALLVGTLGALSKRLGAYAAVAGICCLALGLIIMMFAHAAANSRQERPTATIGVESSNGALAAQVTIAAGNLRPDQYVFVIVQGQNATRHLRPELAGFDPENTQPIEQDLDAGPLQFSKQRLYKGRIGPSPDGGIDASIRLALSPGIYDQIVVQAKILDSSAPAVEEEHQIEFQRNSLSQTLPFRCDASSSDMGCGTALVPLGD